MASSSVEAPRALPDSDNSFVGSACIALCALPKFPSLGFSSCHYSNSALYYVPGFMQTFLVCMYDAIYNELFLQASSGDELAHQHLIDRTFCNNIRSWLSSRTLVIILYPCSSMSANRYLEMGTFTHVISRTAGNLSWIQQRNAWVHEARAPNLTARSAGRLPN